MTDGVIIDVGRATDEEATPLLRFVVRHFESDDGHTHTMHVLQQWWRIVGSNKGEWRDVPLEAEKHA